MECAYYNNSVIININTYNTHRYGGAYQPKEPELLKKYAEDVKSNNK